MDKPVLVIMAAGMGSRYGGLKQNRGLRWMVATHYCGFLHRMMQKSRI